MKPIKTIHHIHTDGSRVEFAALATHDLAAEGQEAIDGALANCRAEETGVEVTYRDGTTERFPLTSGHVVTIDVSLGERDGSPHVASGEITLTRTADGALRHGQPDDADQWVSAPLLRAMREATGVDPGFRCAAFDEMCRRVGEQALTLAALAA